MDDVNSFNNFHRPQMARGAFMWGGFSVVLSPNVPREHVGDEIKAIMPHWLVAWLMKLFGKTVYPVCFVRGSKIEEDSIYQSQDKMFMRPEVWERLKRQIP